MKYVFEWDSKKELENIKKHNLSFVEAKEVFYDEKRIVAVDEKHSEKEPRMFCIGSIGAGYWRKGRALYEEKNNRQK